MLLTLLRHAKTEPGRAGQEDWDRELEARGRRDVPEMARQLKGRHPTPSLIISSPAVRAIATAKLFAKELRLPASLIVEDEQLYLASPKVMLSVVQLRGASSSHLVIVGHNPGITEFGDRLSAERSLDNMPTCSMYTLEFDIKDWSEIQWGSGMNAELCYPGGPT